MKLRIRPTHMEWKQRRRFLWVADENTLHTIEIADSDYAAPKLCGQCSGSSKTVKAQKVTKSSTFPGVHRWWRRPRRFQHFVFAWPVAHAMWSAFAQLCTRSCEQLNVQPNMPKPSNREFDANRKACVCEDQTYFPHVWGLVHEILQWRSSTTTNFSCVLSVPLSQDFTIHRFDVFKASIASNRPKNRQRKFGHLKFQTALYIYSTGVAVPQGCQKNRSLTVYRAYWAPPTQCQHGTPRFQLLCTVYLWCPTLYWAIS